VKVNDAIARLTVLFLLLYAALALRQGWVQVVAGPRIATNAHDPRVALLAPYRGEILARDGTVLARSTAHGAREYPLGPALAQTVGYLSTRYGTSGLESAFDARLSPRPAGNGPADQFRSILAGKPDGAVRGESLITTLDPEIQTELFEALSAYPRAAGVALDPRSGEVLAIASVPSFDPAAIDTGFPALAADAASPLLNRALQGLYPPGSSFKIVTAADALEDGVITPASTFEDDGTLPVGTFVFHNDENEATGRQDLAGAFALSSNVDFGRIALDEGVDRWFEGVARWGLGDALGFELPAARDHLPVRADVSPGVLAQLGFGQADLLVTPLRMGLVGATIAAGGTEPRPFLVRSFRPASGEDVYAPRDGTPLRPVTSTVADEVRTLMLATVTRGTGMAAALPGVAVAGKTGTATLATGRAHAWFVAFAPADAPRVAVAIVVEHGGYGGAAAAPIARRVLAVALRRIKS
jgi:peptidoglycan glycosyltransferase